MCGRFTRLYTWKQLHDLLNLQYPPAAEMRPSYNVAPSQLTDVCRLTEKGERELVQMRWGLSPAWSASDSPAPINARCETVATSPMFRRAFQSRRCLVPASGFYEWQRTGQHKQPYYIHPLNDELFFFAALWERSGENEGVTDTFTILTTGPNQLMANIHNRMPVIIRAADIPLWLSTTQPPERLFEPYPAEETAAHTVSSRVNSPRNNDPQLCEPAQSEGLFG